MGVLLWVGFVVSGPEGSALGVGHQADLCQWFRNSSGVSLTDSIHMMADHIHVLIATQHGMMEVL